MSAGVMAYCCSSCRREGEMTRFLHKPGCSGRKLDGAYAVGPIVASVITHRCTGRYRGGKDLCNFETTNLLLALQHHDFTAHDLDEVAPSVARKGN